MNQRNLALVALVWVACGGDGPGKDTAEENPCLTYVDEWTTCTVAAGEGVDSTLEDPEAYCADNADEPDEIWECLIEAIHEPYCSNIQGLTAIQGEAAACRGY
ncbi:MAG: hypothetical protein CL927_01555 [Deltaproteobacteria bacterium]|nr:hypothetical protein [Deltaproteobacteria bacterium]